MKSFLPILGAMIIASTLQNSFALAASSCFDKSLLTSESVPKCGSADQMQFPDAAKPTGAVFLSFVGSNAETVTTTYEAIKALNQKIKLNLMVTQTDMVWLSSYKNSCNQSGLERRTELNCRLISALEDKDVINLIYFTQPQNERYLQDYLQFYLVDGNVKLFPVVNPTETTDFLDPKGNVLPKYSIASDISKSCEIPQTKMNVSKMMGTAETMGGNLESLPGNMIMLGRDSGVDNSKNMELKDSELAAMIRKYYPPNFTDAQINQMIADGRNSIATLTEEQNLLKGLDVQTPDTKLTQSGHADEVFSVIKSNAKCGYTILMPSPGLALKMLSEERGIEQKENCLSTGGPNLKPNFPNDPRKLADHVASGCVGFRGLTYSEILKDSEFISLNQELETVGQNNEKLIKALLKKSCSEPDILKVPYLITKAPWGANEMITPNAVNALVITPFGSKNSIYINNPMFVKSFDSYFSNELSRRGVEMHLVLDDNYFFGFGGLHCGSSTIQICR